MSASDLPPNSVVLVTGLNGLIATHVADVLLAAGHRVRGTVRSASRSAWLKPLFESRHPDAPAVEIFEVPDSSAPGAWDAVFADGKVAGVASIASGSSMSLNVQDIDAAVDAEMKAYGSLLEAAHKAGSVRSFVFTSSAWAIYTPDAKSSGVLTEDTFNEGAIKLATNPDFPSEVRGFFGIFVMKVRYEKAVWEWVRKNKPAFRFNMVLPDTVLGPILAPRDQGGSTAGMARWLWEGSHLDILAAFAPQWFVDARDCAKLFLAALVSPDLKDRRIFGFGGKYSWPKVLEIFKSQHPDRKDWPELPDAGWDAFEVPASKDAEDILRTVNGGKGWTSLEESVRDGVESFKGQVVREGVKSFA